MLKKKGSFSVVKNKSDVALFENSSVYCTSLISVASPISLAKQKQTSTQLAPLSFFFYLKQIPRP